MLQLFILMIMFPATVIEGAAVNITGLPPLTTAKPTVNPTSIASPVTTTPTPIATTITTHIPTTTARTADHHPNVSTTDKSTTETEMPRTQKNDTIEMLYHYNTSDPSITDEELNYPFKSAPDDKEEYPRPQIPIMDRLLYYIGHSAVVLMVIVIVGGVALTAGVTFKNMAKLSP